MAHFYNSRKPNPWRKAESGEGERDLKVNLVREEVADRLKVG